MRLRHALFHCLKGQANKPQARTVQIIQAIDLHVFIYMHTGCL
jgi:hypothetical protein